MEWMLYVAANAVTFIIAAYLIFHPDYEDGIIGRLALSMLAIPSF